MATKTISAFTAVTTPAGGDVVLVQQTDGVTRKATWTQLDLFVRVPDADGTKDLGSTAKRFRDLHLSRRITLSNAAADPSAAGEVQRNGASLKYHDGTAVRTLASRDAAETLTNKTLTAPVIDSLSFPILSVNDNALTIHDEGDNTKQARFQVSGITSGQTRTFTLPNATATLAAVGVNALGLKSKQVFTASGTWTRPAGIRRVVVEVVGGGGGGGGAAATAASEAASAAGGGGGGYARKLLDVSAIASSTITIGAAGGGGAAGNNNGVAGGASSWADGTNTVTGNGGDGGSGSAAFGVTSAGPSTQAVGGTATGGDVNIQGGSARNGLGVPTSGSVSVGGHGGTTPLGHGGAGGLAGAAAGNGFAGVGFGGGGGGSAHAPSAAAGAGGAGAAGIILVYEYE